MRLTRRHVLAAAALLTLATPGAVGVHWWDQPPLEPYRHLSAEEVGFLDALAEAAFPGGGTPALGGREAGVARYLDALVGGMVGTQRELVRVGMHAVDNAARLSHGVAFQDLDAEDAQAQVRDWLASPVGPLRGIVQSLYLFVGMAYSSHPEVAPHLRAWFGCGFGA